MFNYLNNSLKVKFITDRMVVRLVSERDASLLTEYYLENREYLRPWEPARDQSHYYSEGWRMRLGMIDELHKRRDAFYFGLFSQHERQIYGVANFTGVVRGAFYACYLGYSLGEKWQGKGLMFEALTSAIRYVQRRQHIHRIMANYMPHNQRSASLLARLGFEKEGYAKHYLMIDGVWHDHVLTALVDNQWLPPR